MNRILVLILTLCASLGAGAQKPGQSNVITDSIESTILGAVRHYTVYLPKSYETEPQRHYPILYLLHGLSDTNLCWTEKGHLKTIMDLLTASGEAEEMIIVTPNAGGKVNVDWNGYFNMPGWNYEDFFFTEFMPRIEKRFRVLSDKGHRAIAGLSMGGGGATAYAQSHPELFGSCYAMSALMRDPGRLRPDLQPDKATKRELMLMSVNDHNCIDKVKNADGVTRQALRTVRWFVDCGDDDYLLAPNIEFFQAMKEADIPLEFRVRDGGHTWEYWRSALYQALPFASRNFR